MHFIVIALVIAAAIGGGTSVAAQSALPGDALWGFKVGVNETVGAALAAEGKAQADFDLQVLEARLKETSMLSAEGRLSAEAKAEATANFDAHAKNVAAQIEQLERQGDFKAAADVAARFQATLATHAGESSIDVSEVLDVASTLSASASLKASTQQQ
jgi:broad specificity phosphatase PhoE